MLKTIQNKIQKHIDKRLHKHIAKHQHKHVNKFLHAIHNTHHTIAHMGEMIVVALVGFSSLIFASYNSSYINLHRDSSEEIAKAIVIAMAQTKPVTNQTKIISVWEMDGKIDNTFVPGYCTYGAARISPEFFPYTNSGYNQARTWGGNAVDRCENAQAAGYKISAIPSEGTLVVYKTGGGGNIFGHVGKVMYYNAKENSFILREMNRLGKFVMTDRRDSSTNSNIKCYIYPNKVGSSDTITGIVTVIPPVESGSTDTTTPTISPTPTTPTTTGETTPPTTQETHNAPSTQIPSNIQEPEQTTIPVSDTTTPSTDVIQVSLNKLSDIAQHFFGQNTLQIKKTNQTNIKAGDTINLTIEIKDKTTGKAYEGILPFIFNIVTNNNILDNNISTLQLMKGASENIYFNAKEKGDSSIILTIDDEKIATLPISVN